MSSLEEDDRAEWPAARQECTRAPDAAIGTFWTQVVSGSSLDYDGVEDAMEPAIEPDADWWLQHSGQKAGGERGAVCGLSARARGRGRGRAEEAAWKGKRRRPRHR